MRIEPEQEDDVKAATQQQPESEYNSNTQIIQPIPPKNNREAKVVPILEKPKVKEYDEIYQQASAVLGLTKKQGQGKKPAAAK